MMLLFAAYPEGKSDTNEVLQASFFYSFAMAMVVTIIAYDVGGLLGYMLTYLMLQTAWRYWKYFSRKRI